MRHVQPEQVLLQRVKLDAAVLYPQLRYRRVIDYCKPPSTERKRTTERKENIKVKHCDEISGRKSKSTDRKRRQEWVMIKMQNVLSSITQNCPR